MSLTGQKPTQKPPKPIRDKAHIAFVKSKPCLICGRKPSEAHHVRLGLRTMGRRVCDSKTVPLCQRHHLLLHSMNEAEFWAERQHNFVNDLSQRQAQLWHERTGEWPEWYENDMG